MKNNQVEILSGFLKKGTLTYEKENFSGFIGQPEKHRIAKIKFSIDCVKSIQHLQSIKNGIFNQDIYFSITLTDERFLNVKSNSKTYQKIFERSLSSKKIPTNVIEKPFSAMEFAAFFAIIVIPLFLITKSCSSDAPQDTSTTTESIVSTSTSQTIYSPQKLCKAGIASEFSKPIKIIKILKTGTINELYYIRPDDGSKWRYACKIEGNHIIWATIDIDTTGSNDQGRWRNQYSDGDTKITYELNQATKDLTINSTYIDGSSSSKKFKFNDFSRKN